MHNYDSNKSLEKDIEQYAALAASDPTPPENTVRDNALQNLGNQIEDKIYTLHLSLAKHYLGESQVSISKNLPTDKQNFALRYILKNSNDGNAQAIINNLDNLEKSFADLRKIEPNRSIEFDQKPFGSRVLRAITRSFVPAISNAILWPLISAAVGFVAGAGAIAVSGYGAILSPVAIPIVASCTAIGLTAGIVVGAYKFAKGTFKLTTEPFKTTDIDAENRASALEKVTNNVQTLQQAIQKDNINLGINSSIIIIEPSQQPMPEPQPRSSTIEQPQVTAAPKPITNSYTQLKDLPKTARGDIKNFVTPAAAHSKPKPPKNNNKQSRTKKPGN